MRGGLGTLLLLGIGIAAAADRPDFSGVWQISEPLSALHTTAGGLPPLKPAALSLYQQRVAQRAAGHSGFDPVANCKPPGEPRILFEMGWPFQIGQNAAYLTFMYQWNRLLRIVPLQQKRGALTGPWYFGESEAQWQGDTLVIDVVDEKDSTFLDSAGLPHTDDMHLVERWRLLQGGKLLQLRLRVEDPATYTQAWESELRFSRQPERLIHEDDCVERLGLKNYPTLQASGATPHVQRQ